MAAAVSFKIVIPARYGSTRFPGKALALIAGKRLIQRVFEQSSPSGAEEIVVATDDPRIAAACRDFTARVVMTRSDHRSGTERVAEVAEHEHWSDATIVVNVQGDSPLMPSQSILQVAEILDRQANTDIATLRTQIRDAREHGNPNVVKVVVDQAERALYFSRAAIPASFDGVVPVRYRHLGLYAYRVAALRKLTATRAPCALEDIERLEQLRALWLGFDIRVGLTDADHGPDVDVPADVAAVEAYLRARKLSGETLRPGRPQ